jgi:hypothetical protein
MRYRFFIALFFVALGTFLQIMVGSASGMWFNFALATLISAVFFMSIIELLSLVVSALFVLNWQPAFSFELLVFSALPFVVFSAYKFFPFKPWLMNVIAILLSIPIFYFVFDVRFVVDAPVILLWDIVASTMFGAITFKGLEFAYKKEVV